MESKILCLLAFLALSAGVAYTQAQNDKNDTSTTPVASPSNGSEPNTTVSTAPTTATQSTVTVPTSAVPTSAVPTSAVPSTAAPTTENSNSTGTSIPTVVPTAGGTTDGTVTYDYNGTTPASTPSPTTFQPCTAHSFDAASFVGGIVLGLGVCIIVFFIYKWYQSRHPTAAPYQQF